MKMFSVMAIVCRRCGMTYSTLYSASEEFREDAKELADVCARCMTVPEEMRLVAAMLSAGDVRPKK